MNNPSHHPFRRLAQRALWGWLVAGILVALLCFTPGISEVYALFAAARPIFLLAGIILLAASYLLRAWRWSLAGSFSFGEALRSLSSGMLLNNILPGRGGDLLIPSIQRRLDRPRLGGAFAAFTLLRMADAVILGVSVVLLVLLSLVPAGTGTIALFYAGAIVCVTLGVLFGAGLLERRRLAGMLAHIHRIFPGHLTTPRLRFVQSVLQGFDLVLSPVRILNITALSVAVWALEILVFGSLAAGLSLELSIAELLLLVAVVNLTTLIPISPGGIGLVEWAGSWALIEIGVSLPAAVALVAAQHLAQYLVVALFGVPSVIRLRLQGILSFSGSEALAIQLPQDAHLEFEAAPELHLDSELESLVRQEPASDPESVPELSVVIPAFNEERRLPPTLRSVAEYLRAAGIGHEVLVVDDGSSDRTSEVVKELARTHPEIGLISHDRNRGKGAAVRTGALRSRGRFVLLYDADGATPIEEFPRLQAAIESGSMIAIGSRALYSSDTEVTTVWYRKLLGRIFNAIVNITILPGIGDTQCGFKLFARPAARYLFSRQTAEGFSFDVEILFLARQAGCRISEVPVNWTNIPGSKVHLVRDSLSMLLDVFKFRARHASGRYRAAS